MKFMKIELDGLDIEIDIEAAKSFIEMRAMKKKPLTQRAFDQAMKKSIMGFTVGLTATEVIDYTVEKGWDGINLNFITAAKGREMQAVQEVHQRQALTNTRDISTQQMLDDTSWAN